MHSNLIFLPVLIQIALVIWLYLKLGAAKNEASAAGQVDESRRGLHDDAWPDNVLQINNCIRNQFEVPVLFYICVVLLWLTQSANVVMHLLAWIFVASRIVHARIHTGSNYVPNRRKVFTVGAVIVLLMTAFLIFSIAYKSILTL